MVESKPIGPCFSGCLSLKVGFLAWLLETAEIAAKKQQLSGWSDARIMKITPKLKKVVGLNPATPRPIGHVDSP